MNNYEWWFFAKEKEWIGRTCLIILEMKKYLSVKHFLFSDICNVKSMAMAYDFNEVVDRTGIAPEIIQVEAPDSLAKAVNSLRRNYA